MANLTDKNFCHASNRAVFSFSFEKSIRTDIVASALFPHAAEIPLYKLLMCYLAVVGGTVAGSIDTGQELT